MIFCLDLQGDKTDFVSGSRFFARGRVQLDCNCARRHNTWGDSVTRQHGVGAAWSAVLSELRHGGANTQEHGSSAGSGPAYGPHGVEVSQA
jgi:hypothetical protein